MRRDREGREANRRKAFVFGARLPLVFGAILFLAALACTAALSLPAPPAAGAAGMSPLPAAADQPCVWTGVERIVAVGDLHGDFKNFKKILGQDGTKLIDDRDHWVGGKTHLVQTGDVMDRGDNAKDILDLIRRLEKEAAAAGGMVHFLIGNHEELNILGWSFQHNYVTVNQFKDFLPKDFVESKEAKFKEKAGNGGDTSKQWEELAGDDAAQRHYTRTFNKDYGKWIAEHNAVIKIDDIIFLHAGFNEAFSNWKLETINSVLTKELKKCIDDNEYLGAPVSVRNSRIVYRSEGPLWYRDLVSNDEALMQDEFTRILANLGAKYMVVAHTPLQSAVAMEYMRRFEGRLFMIDTSISSAMGMGGRLSALIYDKGEFSVWPPEDRAGRANPQSASRGLSPDGR